MRAIVVLLLAALGATARAGDGNPFDRLAADLAGELSRSCPPAQPGDQAAFERCRRGLFQDSLVKRSFVPVALASDKDDNHHKNNSNEDDREDRNLEGQVIELYPDRNPPEMVVAQLGGNVTAQILKTDEIALQGVKVGDYVHLSGEYDKGVFYSDAIDVTERYGAAGNDNSN